MKPLIDAVVNDAATHYSNGLAVLADFGRFKPPLPITRPLPSVDVSPSQLAKSAMQWAAGQSLLFHRMCLKNQALATGSALISICDSERRTLDFYTCSQDPIQW